MFLCDVVWLLCGGGLLVGVDFVKDECMLYYVYNDVQGVIVQFNLNLLVCVNVEFGVDFDVDVFLYCVFYDCGWQCIEMYFVSDVVQIVYVCGYMFCFEVGECIYMENLYKFMIDGFYVMVCCVGFEFDIVWIDVDYLFSVYWLCSVDDICV